MSSPDSGWHRRNNNSPQSKARKRQYNSKQHKQLRTIGQRMVDAGEACCWRCGTWLQPGQPWHLGHDDHDRTIYRGPECPACNLTAAARKGAAVANAQRLTAADQDRHSPPRTPARYEIRT